MNIIDISWPLTTNVTTYKNKSDFSINTVKKWETHKVRETLITMGSHSGTHIDAPAHFIEHGLSMSSVDLQTLCGPVSVIDCTYVDDGIKQEDLVDRIHPQSRVLLKTRNSSLPSDGPFDPEFVYLAQSGADYLQEQGVICVGIDYLGIERNQKQHETHNILLQRSIAIIEGLRLAHVKPGDYTLMCLPLLIPDLEAAPARAVLLSD